jgi:uncharacterized SAM-dependent methyltransferase
MIKQEMLFYKKIMHLPEYYVTRSEHEIFKTQSETIIEALQLKPDTYFDLIELLLVMV